MSDSSCDVVVLENLGVLSPCVVDVVLVTFQFSIILFGGPVRLWKLRNRRQSRSNSPLPPAATRTRFLKLKALLFVLLAALPVARSSFKFFGIEEPSITAAYATTVLSLGWLVALAILHVENRPVVSAGGGSLEYDSDDGTLADSRRFSGSSAVNTAVAGPPGKSNWVLRSWAVTAFLVTSFWLQTAIAVGTAEEISVAAIQFAASFVCAVLMLWFNEPRLALSHGYAAVAGSGAQDLDNSSDEDEELEQLVGGPTDDVDKRSSGMGLDGKALRKSIKIAHADERIAKATHSGTVSPEETSSWFSQLFYFWLDPLFKVGFARPLEATDLYPIPEALTSAHTDALFVAAWDRQPAAFRSVFKAIHAVWGRRIWFGASLKLIQDLLVYAQPMILKLLLDYISKPDAAPGQGFLFVGLLFACNIAQSVSVNSYFWVMFRISMGVRGALVASIYRKAFMLSPEARKERTVGQIVNLMAVDTEKIQGMIPYVHMLWSAPLQLVVGIALLWSLMGPSVLAGLAITVLTTPLSGVIMKKLTTLAKRLMAIRDRRVKLMNEILDSIRVIKFFAWEDRFVQRVKRLRDGELEVLRSQVIWRALSTFTWGSVPVLVAVSTFSIFAITGNELTASNVFPAIALLNAIRFPLTMLPMVMMMLTEGRVSMNRIRDYLMAEELDADAVKREAGTGKPSASASLPAIEVTNGEFTWEREQPQSTLQNVNLSIPANQLTIIVGGVGSGKSTLFSAILGDMDKVCGDVVVRGSVAYCSQNPWIQNTSVRDNVLFGKPFDESKYDQAVKVTQLLPDFDVLPSGDSTEIGEKGINLSGGQKQRVALARAVYADTDIYLLDDSLSAVDAHVGKAIFKQCIGPGGVLSGKTRILVTHQLQFVKHADHIIVMKDGQVEGQGTYADLMKTGLDFAAEVREFVTDDSDQAKTASSEGIRQSISETPAAEEAKPQSKPNAVLMSVEERSVGKIGWPAYKSYILASGSFVLAFFTIGSLLIEQGSKLGADYFLAWWTSGSNVSKSVGLFLGVYTTLCLVSAAVSFVKGYTLYLGALRSSKHLHEVVLVRVLGAPVRFFDTTPIGRILNRFAKDVSAVDENIARVFMMMLNTVLGALSIFIMIGIVSPFFLPLTLPLAYLYQRVQGYYLASSRETKRLDSLTKSPIYSQFGETLSGVQTIRAFNLQDEFTRESERKVDKSLSAYYVSQGMNRWLAARVEFTGNIVVTGAALFSVMEKDSVGAGNAGLSISYGLMLTGVLNWLIRMSTELETEMVAVERLNQYKSIDQEPPAHAGEINPNTNKRTIAVPPSWPSDGAIKFKKVCMRYRDDLPPVLDDLTLSIKPCESVGVVGRTGAGKSSFMQAIFRMVELSSGKILIDGIDISQVGLADLRSRISIIPQDPVLFSGTVRQNLDPFGDYDDSRLWSAVDAVHLRKLLSSGALAESLHKKEAKGQGKPQDISVDPFIEDDRVIGDGTGLDSPLTEGGGNLSVGQRQLLCLARALLKESKILILDEATAAVDFKTDALIQQTLRSRFSKATILTIAHRVNTVLDYDRILVLERGRVLEFDTPANLQADRSSMFARMVAASGVRGKSEADPTGGTVLGSTADRDDGTDLL